MRVRRRPRSRRRGASPAQALLLRGTASKRRRRRQEHRRAGTRAASGAPRAGDTSGRGVPRSRGSIALTEVADVAAVTNAIGLSAKRFIERFEVALGLTPKHYCWLQRFSTPVEAAHADVDLRLPRRGGSRAATSTRPAASATVGAAFSLPSHQAVIGGGARLPERRRILTIGSVLTCVQDHASWPRPTAPSRATSSFLTPKPSIRFRVTAAFGANETSVDGRPDGTVMRAEIMVGDSLPMVGQGNDTWPATTTSELYLWVPRRGRRLRPCPRPRSATSQFAPED